jgi:hypothetical protein
MVPHGAAACAPTAGRPGLAPVAAQPLGLGDGVGDPPPAFESLIAGATTGSMVRVHRDERSRRRKHRD